MCSKIVNIFTIDFEMFIGYNMIEYLYCFLVFYIEIHYVQKYSHIII